MLFQLPPKLAFDARVVQVFFARLRDRCDGEIVCEPRHATWFTPEPNRLLADLKIARAAADPAPAPGADRPDGWRGLAYYRLHGSPRMYYSAYEGPYLANLAATLARHDHAWCIFDNTARGAAVENALALARLAREN